MNIFSKKTCMVVLVALAWTALPSVAEEQPVSTINAAPVYRPPLRGAPSSRIGGASRGEQDSGLILSVLAPESTGLTSQTQPTLYWYSSKGLSTPLEFTLNNANDEQSVKPLVEMKVNAPQPGIHALKLNYPLKPEVEYEWNIAVVANPDQRAGDTVASGTVQYVAPPAVLAAQLNSASVAEKPFLYAQESYWYDAVAALSERIEMNPADRRLREQRAALLEQVGLKEAADFDRR